MNSHEHLREQRVAVCERFIEAVETLEANCDDEDVLSLIAFLKGSLCLAEPISSDGEGWGYRLSSIRGAKNAIGLAALLPEDASLHPAFEDHINEAPTFKEAVRTIILPPDCHDLQAGVAAILLIHEGVHARASLERQHEWLGREDPRHWEEELMAYRIEAKAARTLNPKGYEALLVKMAKYLKKLSRFGDKLRDGYQMHWSMPRPIDYEDWLGLPLGDKDRTIVGTAILVAAVDQVLSERYPGESGLEREKAGFIKHLYRHDDVPME